MNLSIGLSASVFAAGILSFFSPCILPIIPLYIGYFSAEDEGGVLSPAQRVMKTLAFVCGISVVFFTLGAGAGLVGSFISGPVFALFCGIFIILMGMLTAGIISVPALEKTRKLSSPIAPGKGLLGAFLLGFCFSFGWTPCVGPVLAAILSFSLEGGNALGGGILLLIYAMGLAVPFVVLSLASGLLLSRVRALYPYLGRIRVAGGLLILVMGIWMTVSQIPRLSGVSQSVSLVSADSADISGGESSEDIAADFIEASADESGGMADIADAGDTGSEGEVSPGNTLSGETVSLSDWAGKIVYLKFWASWCSVCMSELDEFYELCDAYSDDDEVVIYSVVAPSVYGEMDREAFTEWAAAQGISFPVLFDEGGTLTYSYGLRAYPTSVFIDEDQVVRAIRIGHMDNELIDEYIDALKQGA